jgi:hypothetical protein
MPLLVDMIPFRIASGQYAIGPGVVLGLSPIGLAVPNFTLALPFFVKLSPRLIESGSYSAGDGVIFVDDTSLLQSLIPFPNLIEGGF